jgi:NAD-dependent DNA ligase
MPKDTEKQGESNIQDFKAQGITVLEKLSQKELEHMLVVANSNYYNEKGGLMTDNEYDIVKEYIESKYPTNEIVNQIGAPILENVKNKVTLPYEMWSMDKIKPDSNALSKWTKTYKGPYVLSCKLDGVSGLYSTEGPSPTLYTRGDGKVGQDISFLLPHLKLPKKKGIVVRGEFIIPKKVFQEKYAEQFANPRNLVSGIVNSKKSDTKVKDLHFVAYEVIMPKMKPSEQLQTLKTDGFEVVQHETYPDITNESLSNTLVDWRTNYQYEIDGVIVTDDAIYPRTTGNPEHAFAFKMMLSDQKAEVKVVDVVWSPSKDGFLKPRVRIEPVRLGGVTIEYATGYNAKFIEENSIGIGAIIEIIRSGDVIPKIISVTVPAEKAKMPTEEYKWNETHVDILLENASDNSTVQEKKLTAFFSSLEVDGLKAGNVKKLKDAGYDTIPKILQMTKEDFEKVGYKSHAQKHVDTIREKIEKATILQLMAASGTMGRSLGERKIEPILEAHPDILVSTDSVQSKITKVKSVKGVETKTATLFVENIPAFIEFLESIGQTKKLSSPSVSSEPANDVDTSNPLYGKRIVMTKVRDAVISEALEKRGAILDDNIGSKTSILIVKSYEDKDKSNKTEYAQKHNIPMFTPAEFIKKYL